LTDSVKHGNITTSGYATFPRETDKSGQCHTLRIPIGLGDTLHVAPLNLTTKITSIYIV